MDDYDLLETRVRDVEKKQVTALETEHHSVMSDLYGKRSTRICADTVRDFIKEIRTRDATVKTTPRRSQQNREFETELASLPWQQSSGSSWPTRSYSSTSASNGCPDQPA